MSIAYIRETYGTHLKIGERVRIRKGAGTWFDGQEGKLIRAHGAYLVVRGSTWRGNFHPADVESIEGAALSKCESKT